MRLIRVIEKRVLIQNQFDVPLIKKTFGDTEICNNKSFSKHSLIKRKEKQSQSKQKRSIFRIKVRIKTSFNKFYGDDKFEVY